METKSLLTKVGVQLNENGFNSYIWEVEAEEKAKTFTWEGRKLAKEKIGKIDTNHYEHAGLYVYFMFVHRGDERMALDTLRDHIGKRLEKDMEMMNNIKAAFDSEEIKIKTLSKN